MGRLHKHIILGSSDLSDINDYSLLLIITLNRILIRSTSES